MRSCTSEHLRDLLDELSTPVCRSREEVIPTSRESDMSNKKQPERVLGPGAYGDIDNPDTGVQPGLLSAEVMGTEAEGGTREKKESK